MLGRVLVALYPAGWRDRYGDEFQALIDDQGVTPSVVLDVIRGALAAHATASPAGASLMRTRTPALVSMLAVLLVLPAVTFLTAAMVRGMQPPQYQPARAAQVIFDAFAALPVAAVWVLLGLAPFIALVLAVVVAWRKLDADQAAHDDLSAFIEGWRRILRQPALVLSAFAFLASGVVLAFALTHAIVG
jgi:hypothetical protein